MRSAPQGAGRVADGLALLAVTALAFAAFLPALQAGFVNLDDDRMFVENPHYRGFDPEHLRWMFTTPTLSHWMPLTWMSSALDFRISGMDPSSYHRGNLVLHALNAAVFALVARSLIRHALPGPARDHPAALRLASCAAGLLFAVHPLRAESVAWATERSDVLSTFFLLLAALGWLRAHAPGEPGIVSKPAFAASLASLALSLASKSWGMTFVAVAIALDVWPLRRIRSRFAWLEKLPLLGLGLAAAVAAAWAQSFAGAVVRDLGQWGVGARAVQAFYGLAFYVWKTVWPTRLAVVYERPFALDPLEPRFLAAYATVAAGAALAFLLRRRLPGLAVAACVYAVVLLPVLGVLQSGPQLVADRYTYVACLAWAALAGGGLFLAWTSSSPLVRRTAGAAASVVLPLLFFLTWRQARTWHDSRTLWSHALAVGEESAFAHVGLGTLDAEARRFDDAAAHFRRATEIREDYRAAWNNLATALTEAGRYEEAERAWLVIVARQRPAYPALHSLGMLYLRHLGRTEEGIDCLRRAVAEAESVGPPGASSPSHLRLGAALLRSGRAEEGRSHLEIAARDPATREEALRILRP